MLILKQLGPFNRSGDGGRSLVPDVMKNRALLAYLALAREPVDRTRLAQLLFPDRSEDRARKGLRQSQVTLRKTLNGDSRVLPADRQRTVVLDTDCLDVDVHPFERLVASDATESVCEAVAMRRLPGGAGWACSRRWSRRRHHTAACT